VQETLIVVEVEVVRHETASRENVGHNNFESMSKGDVKQKCYLSDDVWWWSVQGKFKKGLSTLVKLTYTPL
jgi:hypothetical protein